MWLLLQVSSQPSFLPSNWALPALPCTWEHLWRKTRMWDGKKQQEPWGPSPAHCGNRGNYHKVSIGSIWPSKVGWVWSLGGRDWPPGFSHDVTRWINLETWEKSQPDPPTLTSPSIDTWLPQQHQETSTYPQKLKLIASLIRLVSLWMPLPLAWVI